MATVIYNKYDNVQPIYTDCTNCGTCDHRSYACPCACHDRGRGVVHVAVRARRAVSTARTELQQLRRENRAQRAAMAANAKRVADPDTPCGCRACAGRAK